MSDPDLTQDRDDKAGTSPSGKLHGISGRGIVTVLRCLVRNARLGIGATYIVIFAAVVIVLLRFVLWEPFTEWIRSAHDLDTFGKILVESPEVYTRERLVNDRLRQTVWLRKQMRATEKVLKEGYFRSHEGQWAQDVAAMMSATWGRDREVGHTGNGQGSNVARTNSDSTAQRKSDEGAAGMNQVETGTSIELFRAMNEYREQVRTELMQTQLDDRHDIDGNTLYRLNFNTTVVHGQRSDALAVIRIRLEHGENREDHDGSLPNDLLHDWAQELERRLNAAARSRVHTLRPTDPPERAADVTDFFLWLRSKICRKLTNIAVSLPDSRGGESPPSPGTIGAVRTWFKADPGGCGEDSNQSMRQGGNDSPDTKTPYVPNQELGDRLDRFIGDYMERYRTAKRDQEFFVKYVEARPELVKELLSRLEKARSEGANQHLEFVRNSLEFYRELGKRWCDTITSQSFGSGAADSGAYSEEPEDPNHKEARKRHQREKYLVQLLCTPRPALPPQQLVLDAVMDLYWRLERLEEQLSYNTKNGFLDSRRLDNIDCNETTENQIEKTLRNQSEYVTLIPSKPWLTKEKKEPWLTKEKKELWLTKEKKAMEGLLDAEKGLACMLEERPMLWRRNLAMQHESDEFNRKFIVGESTSGGSTGILKGIVTVETVGCEAELCRIRVEPDTKSADPADCFYRTLDKDFEVFSYGVTPKNWRQRLAFSGSAIRSMAVALETPELTGKKGMLDGIHRNRETLQSVMSQPIVIGFGRDRSKVRSEKHLERSEHKCDSIPIETSADAQDLNRETEFGWFIAPERRWGDGGGKWHPHRQYDLSAVISIPSWWRRVKLTVSTCWQGLSEIEDLDDEYFDRCGRGNNDGVDDGTEREEDSYHIIKLPGDVGEVSRKLRIEVRDVPYIMNQMYSPRFGQYVFHAGKREDVVIEGRRLWRSTRVTIGTQLADEITVLPHMEGIIATFDCVHRPPFGSIPHQYAPSTPIPSVGSVYAVPLQVWTSEGVTTPPLPVYVVETSPNDGDRCFRKVDSSQSPTGAPAGSNRSGSLVSQ